MGTRSGLSGSEQIISSNEKNLALSEMDNARFV